MKMHQLFAKPGKWTQGASAVDRDGHPVEVKNRRAYAFCLYGGVYKCYKDETQRGLVLDKLVTALEDVVCWNDKPRRTQKQVQALCKKLDI